MNRPPTEGMRYAPWFLTYLELVAVATVFFGVYSARRNDPWAMGDWLINYHAGFVRRGLTGEVALRLGSWLHLSPLVVVLGMQLVCYAAILYTVHRLLLGTRLRLWTAAAVLSPATLGFQVLQTFGGFRKEIILIAGLGVLILLVLRWPKRSAVLVLYLSVFIIVCMLSHESLILFGAYIVAALAIGLGSISRALRLSAIPAIFGGLTLVLVSHHPGNAQITQGICSALGYPATHPVAPPCGGAIDYLTRDLSFAREQLLLYYHVFHYGYVYPTLAALALLPAVMAYFALWRRARRSLVIIAVAAVISFAASFPLFYYALDWGRWIYIHVFCIFLLLFLVEHLRQKNGTVEPIPSQQSSRLRRAACVLFLVLYATCWELPFVGGWRFPSGYLRVAAATLGHGPHPIKTDVAASGENNGPDAKFAK